ncbi:MAG: hypothetical protein ACRC62_37450 [Microcoleus sp.]
MATITGANLTLSLPFDDIVDGQRKVTITVKYNAVFTECERTLSPNLKFQENIQIVGVDLIPPTEQFLMNIFPVQDIPVTTGSGPLTVLRVRTALALRSLLQEDPSLFNDDEIRCKINISYVGASTPVASASADKTLILN